MFNYLSDCSCFNLNKNFVYIIAKQKHLIRVVLILLALGVLRGFGADLNEQNLILQYSFDGGLQNGVEKELEGKLIGGAYGPDYTNGNGNSLLLNGGSKAILASSKLPVGNSPRTITFWVKPLKIGLLNDIVRYGQGDCVSQYFSLGTEAPCCSSDNDEKLSFSSGCNDKSSGLKLVPKMWNFAAASYEAGRLIFCVNGETATFDVNDLNTTKDTNLVVGGSGAGDLTFSGAIDEIKIFDRAFSEGELRHAHEVEQDNREFVALLEDSLKAFFPFDIETHNFIDGEELSEKYEINSYTEDFDGGPNSAAYFNGGDGLSKDGVRLRTSLIDNEFSIFFWLKKTDRLGLVFANDRIPNRSITVTTDEAGKVMLSLVTADWLSSPSYPLESAGYRKNFEFAVVDEDWTHVGIVHSDGLVRAYKNGKLFDERIIENFNGICPPTENACTIADNEYSPFIGALDDLIILKKEVSETDAFKLYSNKLDVNTLNNIHQVGSLKLYSASKPVSDDNGLFVHKSLNSSESDNRFGSEDLAAEFGADLDTVLVDLSGETKSLKAFSLWAKLSEDFSHTSAFDLVVMDFENDPAGSNLRFRHDGQNVPNSLITLSTHARFIDFRGNWFFDDRGKPKWFHLVYIIKKENPLLYVNGDVVAGFDSKNVLTQDPLHQRSVWSNWNGQTIRLSPNSVNWPHKFKGFISDLVFYDEISYSNIDSEIKLIELYDGEDTDGDGLGDWFEYQRGMDRFSADTDSDGLTDYQEMGYGSTYELVQERLSWSEAAVKAQYSGGHLATISSQLENNLVIDYLKSQSRSGRLVNHTWIGGSDAREEGLWEWVTQEPWEYSNWGLNEPSNGKGKLNLEHYLHIVSSSVANSIGVWNDHNLKGAEDWTPTHYLIEYGYNSDPLIADTDGDGLSDLDESMKMTNPYIKSSKLVVLSSEQGSIKLNRTSGYFEQDSLVIAEAVSNPGYAFSRWAGAVDSTDNPVEWMFRESDSIAALYVPVPTILGHPQDKAVPLNGVGSLLVVAENITESSNSPIGYQWFKGDAILEGETGPVLLLDNMTPEKEGSYRVEVSSGSATVSSAAAYVSIILPLEIESIPQTLYLESGTRDFRYEIKFNNNIELQNIVWYRDGKVIPNLETAVYEDGLITSRDNGVYSIYATDGITEVRGDVFTIQAVSGPQIKEISVKTEKASFSFYAAEGNTYGVYKSEDLEKWDLVWSTEGANEEVVYVDDEGIGYSQRFYKVIKK